MILNRRRFLSKYGLDDLNHMQQQNQGYGGSAGGVNPLKAQAVGLLHAVGYLKVRTCSVRAPIEACADLYVASLNSFFIYIMMQVPVIIANIITIVFEILLGG
jgi:hypothetical protein